MLKKVSLVLICLFATLNIAGQVNDRKSIFFTRIALPDTASGCRIEISANEISPSARDCEFTVPFGAGAEVRLLKQTPRGKWMKLKLSAKENWTFEIYVDNSSRRRFLDTFNLILSRTERDAHSLPCDAKTKREVIRSVGIPTTIERKGKEETWHYGIDHPSIGRPGICGFDASSIEFRGKRVLGIGGII